MSVERDYPRAIVAFLVDVVGEEEPMEMLVVPRRVTVTRRPHTHADTADIELDGTELPFDPRIVESVVVRVFMGQALTQDDDAWRSNATTRFIGFIDNLQGEQEDDDTITLKARDLSAAMRELKPLPAAAVPTYGDTLGSALRRILNAAPGGEELELDLVEGDVSLGPLVSARAQSGPIHLEPNMTAWAVVEYIAGLANRLVLVELGVVRVVPTRNVYADGGDQTPHVELVFNRESANLTKLGTNKKFVRNRKGVRVVAFDAVTRTRVEVDYPPDDELPVRQRAARPRAAASSHSRATRARAPTPAKPPERDVFPVQGVVTRARMLEVARGIWQERSRQELAVTAETPFFSEDFLSLRNGDRARVQLNRVLAAGLNRNQPRPAQIALVMKRLAVSRQAAEVLLNAALNPGADLFYVHEVTLRWGYESDIGVRMEMINLIALGVEGVA